MKLWNLLPNNVKIVLAMLLMLLLGYAFGKYFTKSKVDVKTQIITHTVVVNHHDVKIVTHTVHEPNGTIITDSTTQDNSVISTTGSQNTKDKDNTTQASISKDNWQVNAMTGLDFTETKFIYGVDVKRKLFGPVYVGAWGLTNSTVGLSVGMEF